MLVCEAVFAVTSVYCVHCSVKTYFRSFRVRLLFPFCEIRISSWKTKGNNAGNSSSLPAKLWRYRKPCRRRYCRCKISWKTPYAIIRWVANSVSVFGNNIFFCRSTNDKLLQKVSFLCHRIMCDSQILGKVSYSRCFVEWVVKTGASFRFVKLFWGWDSCSLLIRVIEYCSAMRVFSAISVARFQN